MKRGKKGEYEKKGKMRKKGKMKKKRNELMVKKVLVATQFIFSSLIKRFVSDYTKTGKKKLGKIFASRLLSQEINSLPCKNVKMGRKEM